MSDFLRFLLLWIVLMDLRFIVDDPPRETDPKYDDWYADDISVQTWMRNNITPTVQRFSMMEDPKLKLSLNLGSETYSLNSGNGVLSEQLAAVKEASMIILKDFITKHNVPTDVPDELVESSSEDESGKLGNPPKKTKKQK